MPQTNLDKLDLTPFLGLELFDLLVVCRGRKFGRRLIKCCVREHDMSYQARGVVGVMRNCVPSRWRIYPSGAHMPRGLSRCTPTIAPSA